jgi:hypothetical protein
MTEALKEGRRGAVEQFLQIGRKRAGGAADFYPAVRGVRL